MQVTSLSAYQSHLLLVSSSPTEGCWQTQVVADTVKRCQWWQWAGRDVIILMVALVF